MQLVLTNFEVHCLVERIDYIIIKITSANSLQDFFYFSQFIIQMYTTSSILEQSIINSDLLGLIACFKVLGNSKLKYLKCGSSTRGGMKHNKHYKKIIRVNCIFEMVGRLKEKFKGRGTHF